METLITTTRARIAELDQRVAELDDAACAASASREERTQQITSELDAWCPSVEVLPSCADYMGAATPSAASCTSSVNRQTAPAPRSAAARRVQTLAASMHETPYASRAPRSLGRT
jgi:hypothetical protein